MRLSEDQIKNIRKYGTPTEQLILADLEEARAALRCTQWVYDTFCLGGSVPMGMICPVCGNHRPDGHTADCLVGNAIGAPEQPS